MRATLLAALLLVTSAAPGWSADHSPTSSAKLDHDVKGFNFLIGTFGLKSQYQRYAAQHVAQKTSNDGVQISDGWLKQGESELKQGQAMPGGDIPNVDAAANVMIPILDRLIERLKGLDAYYASRGQLEDHFARGKREDRLVLADFKAALDALGPLSEALDAAIDRRDTAALYVLQQQGDMVGFTGGMAMHEAKRLLALFENPQALHDPKVTARGDTLADAIVESLADERKALATVEASGNGDHALRNSMYGVAAESLQQMVGAYREMRHTGNAALDPMMVAAYNSAVENVNVGQ